MAKSPLEEVRNLLQDNRRYFEEVKQVTKQRERQAEQYLSKAVQAQEIEKLELELKMQKAQNVLHEIRIAQQELSGVPAPALGVGSRDQDFCLLSKGSNSKEQKQDQSLSVSPLVSSLSQDEMQQAMDRIQQELSAKQELQVRIEALDKKNADLQVLLKQSEESVGHIKQQAMALVRQRTQEVRAELTTLMEANLKAKSYDGAGQSVAMKQYQQLLEVQEKKNLALESDLRTNSQQVVLLEKKLVDTGQKVNQLESKVEEVAKENVQLQVSLQSAQQEALHFKQEAVEVTAKSQLIKEDVKRSIDYLTQERTALINERKMMAQIIYRERQETEEKILALKNKLINQKTLFTATTVDTPLATEKTSEVG